MVDYLSDFFTRQSLRRIQAVNLKTAEIPRLDDESHSVQKDSRRKAMIVEAANTSQNLEEPNVSAVVIEKHFSPLSNKGEEKYRSFHSKSVHSASNLEKVKKFEELTDTNNKNGQDES